MTQYSGGQYTGPVMTPPIDAGDVAGRPTSWPMVLGIILIVLASLGLLANGCGGIVNLFLPAIMSNMPQQGGQGDPMMQVQVDVIQKYMGWNVANAVVMIVLGIILLVGGIGLVKRKRSGVKMSFVWALGRIIWAIPATYFGILIMNDTFAGMKQAAEQNSSANRPPPGFMGAMQSLGAVGVAIGVIMACAIPVFMLIWLNRPSIKSETAHWR